MTINYRNIADSIDFYTKHGIEYIESPWTVSKEISGLTKPEEKKNDYEILHNKKTLVASGEQSFLYLMLKGFLPRGTFQTVTPCFRDDLFDLTHTKYFIKNELINTKDVTNNSLHQLIDYAFKFYSDKLSRINVEKVKTDEGYDINFISQGKRIEIGSYGIRRTEIGDYVYGTGCAEPRLSHCQKLLNNTYETILK